MAKDVFVLKIVDVHKNEHLCILGNLYSKLHVSPMKKGEEYLDYEGLSQVIKHVKEHSINGINWDTLDFIVDAENNVYSLSHCPFGNDVECFYIMVNGNTISKIIPKNYTYEELKKVWDTYE